VAGQHIRPELRGRSSDLYAQFFGEENIERGDDDQGQDRREDEAKDSRRAGIGHRHPEGVAEQGQRPESADREFH